MQQIKKKGKKISGLLTVISTFVIAIMLNLHPEGPDSSVTNKAFADSGCDAGCYCVAGQKASILGCIGDNQWCKVDCRC